MKTLAIAAVTLVIAGCSRQDPKPIATAKPQQPATPSAPATSAAAPATAPAKARPGVAPPSPTTATPVPAACQPHADLAKLDPRKPVPLLPMMAWHQKQNMQDHLLVIQQISAALAKDDWDAVAKAATRIEPSDQMKMMCTHMGAGAEGFTPMAMQFHERAVAIGKAAKNKDAKGVLAAMAHTIEACTGCHAAYRQEVVDHDTWRGKTGMAAPTGGHHP